MSVKGFFDYARERYQIKLAREAGLSAEQWTRDPVLRKYRFCHVFREDDRTTVWFRDNIREPLRNEPRKVALATIGFRWFNRIETGELIKGILLRYGWSSKLVMKALHKSYRKQNKPMVTGAYMVHTPPGMDKLDGLCQYMDQLIDVRLLQQRTLQAAHEQLVKSPGQGAFTAYEVVTDLRYTCVLEHAMDILTWASPGPGAARGLEWIYDRSLSRSSKSGIAEQVELMRILLTYSSSSRLWPVEWPAWDMRTVEHTLCEYDKYRRGQKGLRLKRRYP